MLYGKIWGITECIFNKNNVSIHRISINKGGTCSKHYHEHKHNTFYIEKGKLKILIWQQDYALMDETTLTSGQSTSIKPGLNHQFLAIEDTIAYEIYHVELADEDIVREGCGSNGEES